MEYIAVIILVVFVICFLGYRIKYSRERFSAPQMSMYDYPFETGDLVLADGTGYVPAFSPSSVDHAAIVYREPKTGQLFLWHTANDFLYVYAFQPLFRALEKYKLVFIRKLYGRRQLLRPWDRSFQQLLQKENLTFETGIYLPALAQNIPILLGPVQQPRPRKTIFCTTLALQTYIHLGVFSPAMLQQKDHLWLTSDLCSWSQAFPLPFLNGFSFGPETRLIC
jgi:hypothetical protein